MFSKYQAPTDCSITVEESWGMNALMFSSKVIGTVYVHCPSLLAVDLIQDYDLLVLMARATTCRRTRRALSRNAKAHRALVNYLQLPYEQVCCKGD